MTDAMEYAEYCFSLLENAKRVTVLTGAGVSTLSGIPDFRGRNGVYRNGGLWHGVARETLLEISFFHRHPELFYQFAAEELYPMLDKTPSIAHETLAQLQKLGVVKGLFTQNIDCLHTKAGATAHELHGALDKHRCLRCGAAFPVGQVRAEAEAGRVPKCPCGGIIKPEVVFYGEGLDEALLERAFDEFGASDVALILGSSLTVSPVSSLPGMTKQGGGQLVIVNEQPTQYDRTAAFRFPDIAGFCAAARRHWGISEA